MIVKQGAAPAMTGGTAGDDRLTELIKNRRLMSTEALQRARQTQEKMQAAGLPISLLDVLDNNEDLLPRDALEQIKSALQDHRPSLARVGAAPLARKPSSAVRRVSSGRLRAARRSVVAPLVLVAALTVGLVAAALWLNQRNDQGEREAQIAAAPRANPVGDRGVGDRPKRTPDAPANPRAASGPRKSKKPPRQGPLGDALKRPPEEARLPADIALDQALAAFQESAPEKPGAAEQVQKAQQSFRKASELFAGMRPAGSVTRQALQRRIRMCETYLKRCQARERMLPFFREAARQQREGEAAYLRGKPGSPSAELHLKRAIARFGAAQTSYGVAWKHEQLPAIEQAITTCQQRIASARKMLRIDR